MRSPPARQDYGSTDGRTVVREKESVRRVLNGSGVESVS